jgi:hypothetical protein
MSTAATHAESAPDRLDLYRFRDDLARSYNPANAHERMLVTQITRAWLRLQKAYDREEQFFGGREMDDVMASDSDHFKVVARYLSDCERAWRHAVENLEKAQRRRIKGTLASPNSRSSRKFFAGDCTPAPPDAAQPEAPVVPAPEASVVPTPVTAQSSEIHRTEKNAQEVATPVPECYIGSAATWKKPDARASAGSNPKKGCRNESAVADVRLG